jgi:hypothetical protein
MDNLGKNGESLEIAGGTLRRLKGGTTKNSRSGQFPGIDVV